MDELELKKQLEEKRKTIRSLEELSDFLKYVKENGNTGYGEAVRSAAQAMLAVGYYFADDFGITEFQAGCIMWDFLRGWMFSNNECGLKIIDYDNMLYPQYEDKFKKTISLTTFEKLKSMAQKRLDENKSVHPAVKRHWEKIVNGEVPFGYEIKGE